MATLSLKSAAIVAAVETTTSSASAGMDQTLLKSAFSPLLGLPAASLVSLFTVTLSLMANTITQVLVSLLIKTVYNVYFHPLRSYPGPWLARASRIPFLYYQVTGNLPHGVKRWHEQYGDTIRIAPNDISFVKSQAWFDIHGMC